MNAEKLDDTFERALTEYRVRHWDTTEFRDLPENIQQQIRDRACQLAEAEERLNARIHAA